MQKLDLVRLYSEKRALVVDEFPDMRASIRRMLRSFGVEIVDLANDGSEAMMRCRENEYDIIICDYSLGAGKNGQQILEELRHTQSFKHQAIYILITAETTRSMVFGALEYKPDDYLTKPFTQVWLQSRLDKIVLEKQFFSSVYKALDNGDYLAAASNAEALVGRHSEYRTAAQKLQGHALLLAKEYERANSLYQAVMDVRRQEWACIGCARALIGLQKWSSAIHVLSELIDHGTENLEVFDALAEAELALGRNGVAQAILERATVSSPYGILRQINLAEVALANNDYLAAEKAYRRVIKLGLNSCHDSHEHSLGLVRCLLDKEKKQL
ncbi:MAG: response regulator, partial [Pseudomonadales bacterium]